jgi:magnesium-transporting ATPase (P-type)
MVVVTADHLLVDESALTGEATPIIKVQIDATMKAVTYDSNLHKTNTISAGTTILESGDKKNDLGLVLATGSFTTKGKLLSDVLSYQRHNFHFDDEVKIVLFILILEAVFLITMVFHFLQDQVSFP